MTTPDVTRWNSSLGLRLARYVALGLSFFFATPPLSSMAGEPIPFGRPALLALLCFAAYSVLGRFVRPAWADAAIQTGIFVLFLYTIYTRVSYC